MKKPGTHLLTIHQGDGESLPEFVGRFMVEIIKVSDCSDDVARMTFMFATINNPDLIHSYALQPARTYSEAIQRARQYMHAKDELNAKQLQHQTITSKHAQARGQSSQSKKSYLSRDQEQKKLSYDNRQ